MARNVNDWYTSVLYQLRGMPIENSRNGMVKSVDRPTLWTITSPTERVLFCPERKCNPYLHVMETVWMFAGCKDVEFLLPFSRQMGQYADDDGTINGAYGHRWRRHWDRDQIVWAINHLQEDPESRQCVIAMYDPKKDWVSHWKDRPCNTHIYLRVVNGRLDMTVCNRSNDAIWGMTGANAVHMTYLQELIAAGLKRPVGRYHVMTNNLHIYQHHWPMLDNPLTWDHYLDGIKPYPLLGKDETSVWEFLNECEHFVEFGPDGAYKTKWIKHVVVPMYEHYMCRLNRDYHSYDVEENLADDWRLAEVLWRSWNDN